MTHHVQGLLRSAEENEIISSGNIWDNLPLVEKSLDAIDFTRLKQAVKINKFPAFRDLNRKDLLWKNFRRMQLIFGKQEFGFHPDTYYLPEEASELHKRMKMENYEEVYIVKLPNNFCGIGACVVRHPSKIPHKKKVHQEKNKKVIKEDPIIVQKYLTKPYLINGYKFDFRIYVLITSIAPLRIYLYKDGLVRFATEKFSLKDEDLENTFIHLTNFTVNKNGESVTDFPPGCQVNKWTIYQLWEYFKKKGEDPSVFWEAVKDVVIKTVLCAHEKISREVENNSPSFYNNYNLLGLDIFIDENMRPNLLEVNTIPSLFINSISKDIDTNIKGPLVAETLNICGHHISSSVGVKYKQEIINKHLTDSSTKNIGFDHRLYVKTLNAEERKKQEYFMNKYLGTENKDLILDGEKDDDEDDENEKDKEDPLHIYDDEEEEEKISGNCKNNSKEKPEPSILDNLTPCDVRVLINTEDELTQTELYERIFPTIHTKPYLDLMNKPSYYDLLLTAWEEKYLDKPREGLERLLDECIEGKHLIVPESEKRMKTPFKPVSEVAKKGYNVPHIFKDK
ncbi:tubulin polyglutamylase TTLL4 isoform X2 [Eurytemora carolleeae]|uniref:tubulin polyglutamylase TTLL4 isoform X2 n=1 Tax=Eurytemora carolleeae TaxID=1294199 RepID=UPI000C7612FF|nr:tubulin polyglutamylase TTLL4 isoform X2 [Eurytemora carolleeae]|eukprot:XP_023340842.1 tubulin polyglutamylase TTLL4-like isoform X2 [Eurytemora affinis]